MLSPKAQELELPLVTVGIVVLNREWIIKRMLQSVQSQTYPHERLFVVVVDGKSGDKTAEIAKQFLAESDFSGYQVIVKDSNIPEARNICVNNMKGDYLLFWDSDVILEPKAVAFLVETIKERNADIVKTYVSEVTVGSVKEIDTRWAEWKSSYEKQEHTNVVTGNMLIAKDVFNQIAFDLDYTFYEDLDFRARAAKAGFSIFELKDFIGFDVNSDKAFSDSYGVDMSIKDALRGLGKKGKIQAQVIAANSKSTRRVTATFLWHNKRYLIYTLYAPAIIVTITGLFLLNLWLSLVFPACFLLYTVAQCIKRGPSKGLNVAIRSVIIGIPSTYILLYYLIAKH